MRWNTEPVSHRARKMQKTLSSEFDTGMGVDQTMEGSKQKPTRGSRFTSKGMNQPVKSGTRERKHAPYKGDRV